MKDVVISICIASFRGTERLKRLFTSMKEAELFTPLHEIVVVDDGSPVDEYRGILELQTTYPIKVFRLDVNSGYVAATQAAVKNSTGEIILLLNDDVLWPKNLSGVMRELFSTLKNVGALSWRSYGPNPGQSLNEVPGYLQPATELASYCMAFRRDVWNEVGGLDLRFKHFCSDNDLALRMTLAGHPSYRIWWPLISHEEHAAFRNAPELSYELTTHSFAYKDLALFKEKWGKTGPEMEVEALGKLVE